MASWPDHGCRQRHSLPCRLRRGCSGAVRAAGRYRQLPNPRRSCPVRCGDHHVLPRCTGPGRRELALDRMAGTDRVRRGRRRLVGHSLASPVGVHGEPTGRDPDVHRVRGASSDRRVAPRPFASHARQLFREPQGPRTACRFLSDRLWPACARGGSLDHHHRLDPVKLRYAPKRAAHSSTRAETAQPDADRDARPFSRQSEIASFRPSSARRAGLIPSRSPDRLFTRQAPQFNDAPMGGRE